MLGHPDAGDRVVRGVEDVSVVLDADLDQLIEPERGDAVLGVGGLLVGEGDAHGPHAVLASGVHDE